MISLPLVVKLPLMVRLQDPWAEEDVEHDVDAVFNKQLTVVEKY